MNQIPPELMEEAPLDPAAERLRRKMVRLMGVSIGIMFIGVFAVLAVVIFRLGDLGRQDVVRAELAVPQGFAVTQSDTSAGRIALRGTDAQGQSRILLFDTEGALVGDYLITERE